MSFPDETDKSEVDDAGAFWRVELERIRESARRTRQDARDRTERASETMAQAERLRERARALRSKIIRVP